jgi:hypothetical protein
MPAQNTLVLEDIVSDFYNRTQYYSVSSALLHDFLPLDEWLELFGSNSGLDCTLFYCYKLHQ